MNRFFLAGLLCLPSFVLANNNEPLSNDETNADLIVFNGHIKTADTWVQAMAVSKGKILSLGKFEEVKKYQNKSTALLDLAGKTVLPGIHDAHVHPFLAGIQKVSCQFPSSASLEQITTRVSACVNSTQGDAWVTGGNWSTATLDSSLMNTNTLDAISTETPILLHDVSQHSIWVNSKVMELAGVNVDTKSLGGGVIELDASGQPSGVFRENARNLIFKVMPLPGDDAIKQALISASDEMLSYGITSYFVARTRPGMTALFAEVVERNKIKQNIQACVTYEPELLQTEPEKTLLYRRLQYSSAQFRINCVKLFVDGVPTESKTAAMLDPYFSEEGTGQEKGELMIPQPALNQLVARFDKMGLGVKFHVSGDAAVRAAIDAVEYARNANGFGGPMHHLGHNSFAAESDLTRTAALNIGWEFSPYIWYPNPLTNVVRLAVGENKMKRFMPIADAVLANNLVVTGSDWPIVPSVNPWVALETLVTRQSPGASDDDLVLGADQRINLDQAFDLMTRNSALLMGQLDKTGTLELGKRADFIITQHNPFEMPVKSVHKTRVLSTYINGNLVFSAELSD